MKIDQKLTQKICMLYNNGKPVKAISEELDMSQKLVRKHLALGDVKMRLSSPSKDDIVKITELFENGESVSNICSKVGFSASTIRRCLKAQGYTLKYYPPKNMSRHEIDDMILLYQTGFSTVDIAKKYNMCDNTVASILRSQGVEIRSSGSRAIIDNPNFFSVIDTESKAYLLGLLYADGSIGIYNGNHTIQLSLVESDSYLIEYFMNQIGVNKVTKDVFKNEYNISRKRIITSIKNGRENMCSTSIISKEIYDDLIKLGVRPQKTFDCSMPKNIPDNVMNHFIRGFFDGDGTVYTCRNNTLTRKPISRFGFYGTEEMMIDVRDYLSDTVGLSRLKVTNKINVSTVTWGKIGDIQKFYNYIYNNASIYMTRKRDKFDEILGMEKIPR